MARHSSTKALRQGVLLALAVIDSVWKSAAALAGDPFALETLLSVAGQVERLAADGKSLEEVRSALNLSDFEARFTERRCGARLTLRGLVPRAEAAYNVATGKDNEILASATATDKGDR